MKATVIFVIKDNKILLARKMKKVGVGKWNGYGGKPEEGDISLRHTACRELFEESGTGVVVAPEKLIPKALVDFFFFNNDSDEPNWSVAFYIATDFTGEAKSTDEMQTPSWFPLTAIPYDDMLPADKDFLPKVLVSEKTFHGKVQFNEAMDGVLESTYIEKSVEILGI